MRGWPDYTRVTGLVDNYDEYGQNYPIGGGDIAARIGSIKTYDMRGRVWWMDDFEAAALHWQPINIGVGGAQRLVSDYVRNGEQALGLQANTGAIRRSTAYRIFNLPRKSPIGFEIHFAQEANFGLFEIKIELDDAVTRTETNLQIDSATELLTYTDELNAQIDTGLNTGLLNNLVHFHAIKVAFDYQTDEYLRILYDDQELDMTGIPMWTPATTGGRWLYVQIEAIGDNVNNARMCFDDVIITVMEPE